MAWWIWLIIALVGGYIVFSITVASAVFRFMLVNPHFSEKSAPLSKTDKSIFFDELDKALKWFDTQKKEDVFLTVDGFKLHGIFLNSHTAKSVILIHGYGAQLKYRIQDAPFYINHGYNVLLIDLRTHGKSEGKFVSLGKFEATDLLEWTKWLSQRTNNSKIVLDGVSMGAATVACSLKLDLPKNVAFAVCDCSYTSMCDLVVQTSRKMLMPHWLLVGFGELYARRLGKFSLYKNSPLNCVEQAKIPVIFIHGLNDKLIPNKMSDKLFQKCPTEKMLLKIEKAGHAMSFCYDRQRCEKAILNFEKKFVNDC